MKKSKTVDQEKYNQFKNYNPIVYNISMNKNIEKNPARLNKIIIENIVKMLDNRKFFGDVDPKNILEQLYSKINDEMLLSVDINQNKKLLIKFVFTKLTTIKKMTGLNSLMLNDSKYHKIIVTKNISSKADLQFRSYVNTEVFDYNTLKFDIVSHHYQPKFEPLSKQERNELFQEYKISPNDLNKMYANDPVAKYYFLNPGDVIRVIRPNISSGESINYRLIIGNR